MWTEHSGECVCEDRIKHMKSTAGNWRKGRMKKKRKLDVGVIWFVCLRMDGGIDQRGRYGFLHCCTNCM